MRSRMATWCAVWFMTMVAQAQPSFVNWENLGVHSLDMTPDGTRLLVANTADNRLEVFDLTGEPPTHLGSVPVGLDPVAVRARTDGEAWVVNHISDSVSVVNLATLNVVATLATADEPADVVFAGAPGRAFVTCSQANLVQVFNPADLLAAPIDVPILGEDPKALAASPDGTKVYAAIFESGNATTILGGGIDPAAFRFDYPPNVVSEPDGPWQGDNPPPNDGEAFVPPVAPGLPTPVKVGLIVRKDDQGRWMDDNSGDWTELVSGAEAARSGRPVGWDMPDRDLAVIDANTLGVTYATGLMNICMAVGVNPATGVVTVVGTDAINQVRFEPNVNGVMVRVHLASVNPADLADKTIVDLNPHLTYSGPTAPQAQRDRSIGDPRAIVWNAAGTKGYVAGLGSNNVSVIDATGARIELAGPIDVAEGPIALALDEPRGRIYTYNRFAGTVSIIDTALERETARMALFDPTPPVINTGRRHLYDTHDTSGLGQSSCASCHVDGRIDRLAWDLGDPTGSMVSLGNNNLGAGIFGLRPGTTPIPFESFHPMKGPMTTQTLQDIIGHEPHHWRGDRTGIEAFNPAYMTLLGDDAMLSTAEIQEFEDFLATVRFPPNPYRHIDNSMPTALPLPGHTSTGQFAPVGQPLPPGNAQNGVTLYTSVGRPLNLGVFACATCHTLPTGAGTDRTWTGSGWTRPPLGPNGEQHLALVSVDGSTNRAIKIPQLRNVYEKVGFTTIAGESAAGFGLLHDGSIDTIERFVSEPVFELVSVQEVADLVAFMLCFSGSDLPGAPGAHPLLPPGRPSLDTHAAVGTQVTFNVATVENPEAVALYNVLLGLAGANKIGLIAKGVRDDLPRGYVYDGISRAFQADRAAEFVTANALRLGAGAGAEITVTAVPKGMERRVGVDRDEDGFFDRDELDRCADPADADSIPGSSDADADLDVDLDDFARLQQCFTGDGLPTLAPDCCFFDTDTDGDVDEEDYARFATALEGPDQ